MSVLRPILVDNFDEKWTALPMDKKVRMFNCWFCEPTQLWDPDQGIYIVLARPIPNYCSCWDSFVAETTPVAKRRVTFQ
jgi:hypothetical protein